MKILLATQTRLDAENGASAQSLGLARALARQGHAVTLLAPHAACAGPGIRALPTPAGLGPGLRLEAWMAHRIGALPAAELPDVAHVRISPSTSLVPAALRRRRVPAALALHGPVLDELREAGRGRLACALVQRMLRRAVRRAAVILVLDAPLERFARERLGAERVHVAQVGVDLDAVRPGSRAAARARLGIDPEQPLVGFAGTLGTGLRLDLVAPALARLPGVALAVVGDGPMRAGLERAVRDAGLAERVRLVGRLPREETLAWMQAADVCIELRAGHVGTKCLEYAALARRHVAFACAGTEWLRTLYDPPLTEVVGEPSAAELAAAVLRALAREREAEPPTPAAIASARAQLGWERAACEVANLLASAATTGRY